MRILVHGSFICVCVRTHTHIYILRKMFSLITINAKTYNKGHPDVMVKICVGVQTLRSGKRKLSTTTTKYS